MLIEGNVTIFIVQFITLSLLLVCVSYFSFFSPPSLFMLCPGISHCIFWSIKKLNQGDIWGLMKINMFLGSESASVFYDLNFYLLIMLHPLISPIFLSDTNYLMLCIYLFCSLLQVQHLEKHLAYSFPFFYSDPLRFLKPLLYYSLLCWQKGPRLHQYQSGKRLRSSPTVTLRPRRTYGVNSSLKADRLQTRIADISV